MAFAKTLITLMGVFLCLSFNIIYHHYHFDKRLQLLYLILDYDNDI